jgi:hypothetical protein
MTPEPLDIIVKRGMTWEWSVLWLDENDAPIDNTGYDFTMVVHVVPSDGTPALTLSTSAGHITPSGSSGYIDFLVGASATTIDSIRYVFALTSDAAGVKKPVSEGTLTVED